MLACYAATRAAVTRARSGAGPTLIEAHCVRLTPHSSDDNDRTYRPAAELKDLRSHDPVARYREYLREQGVLDDLHEQELCERIQHEVDDATTFAERSSLPDASTLLKHVYADS